MVRTKGAVCIIGAAAMAAGRPVGIELYAAKEASRVRRRTYISYQLFWCDKFIYYKIPRSIDKYLIFN